MFLTNTVRQPMLQHFLIAMLAKSVYSERWRDQAGGTEFGYLWRESEFVLKYFYTLVWRTCVHQPKLTRTDAEQTESHKSQQWHRAGFFSGSVLSGKTPPKKQKNCFDTDWDLHVNMKGFPVLKLKGREGSSNLVCNIYYTRVLWFHQMLWTFIVCNDSLKNNNNMETRTDSSSHIIRNSSKNRVGGPGTRSTPWKLLVLD